MLPHHALLAIPPLLTLMLLPPGYFYYNNYLQQQRQQPYRNIKNDFYNHVITPPPNFPNHIPINYTTYENWAGEIRKPAWIASPENSHQILDVTNWARHNGFKIRPSGGRFSFSPLTVQNEDYPPERVVIVDTTQHLRRMAVISSNGPGNSVFWAEPGISLEKMLTILEEHNLSLGSFPTHEGPSLGGILAVGAHGLGSFGAENVSDHPPDHHFGSISNLIISLTAVVFDPKFDRYVLKEFHRSDEESKAFLVNFGRAFITNVTIKAGPLVNFYTHTRFDVPADEVFSPPNSKLENSKLEDFKSENLKLGNPEVENFESEKDYSKPEKSKVENSKFENSFASTLKKHSRAVAVYFEFAHLVELKTWEISPQKPDIATEVTDLYFFPEIIFDRANISHLWGTSKNVMIVVGKDFPRASLAGWVVITNQDNIQKVVHTYYEIFKNVLATHRSSNKDVNLHVGLEVRTAELDHPGDIGIRGAESPGLGSLQPIEDRPDLNVAVHLYLLSANVFSTKQGQAGLRFAADVEKLVWQTFSTNWSVVRPEWPMSWALTEYSDTLDIELIRRLRTLGKFSSAWEESVAILNKYDPFHVFSSRLIEDLLDHQTLLK